MCKVSDMGILKNFVIAHKMCQMCWRLFDSKLQDSKQKKDLKK